MWKKITEFLAAVGGAIISFFTTLPPLVYILVGVMSLDYITGLICGAMGKSKKTENGYLASREALKGLLKKMLIIAVVVLAAAADYAVRVSSGMVQFDAVLGATCLWFVASEGLSILENVASMGVPVPQILLNLLEIMKSKGDGEKKPEEQTDE